MMQLRKINSMEGRALSCPKFMAPSNYRFKIARRNGPIHR